MKRPRLLHTSLSLICLLGALLLPLSASASLDTDWLNAAYQAFLDRPADPGALSHYTPGGTLIASRPLVALSIDTSLEYRSDFLGGGTAAGLFQDFLVRNPSSFDLQNFTSAMQAGATDEQVEAAILGSPELYSDAGGTDAGFVSHLYQDVLGRPASGPEIANWVGILATPGTTRVQVADAVLSSNEYRLRLVDNAYLKFLCRPADSLGENFFLNALGSGITDEQMYAFIVGSPEFPDSCSGGGGSTQFPTSFPNTIDAPVFPLDNAFLPPALQTPEPASAMLLLSGVAGVFLRRRKH